LNESKPGPGQFHQAVAQSLADATRRAMQVAGEDENGDPAPMSKTDLAKAANVSRNRLMQVLDGASGEERPNPTLESICSIAEALRVPPAFLLMRAEDWAALGTGFVTFFQAATGDNLKNCLPTLSDEIPAPYTVARAAVDFGVASGALENEYDSRASLELRNFRKRAKHATAAIAAALPFRRHGLASGHAPLLLCAASIVGTTLAQGNP